MAQAEVIQRDMPSATTNLPTKMVSIPKTQGPVRPERSVLIKWAYGTGTADQEEDDYDAYKMWETHCDNPVANFSRRGEVMSINAGVTVRPDENLGARIGSFPWPGQDIDGNGRSGYG
jgi:hypothetical protein